MSKDLIVKYNKLISAKYSLGLNQTRFIAHMASMVKKNDIDFCTYQIRLKKLLDILKIERRHWKTVIKTLNDLMGKIIIIEDSDSVVEKSILLSYFKIDIEKEIVEYRFDKTMKPYLLDLNSQFKKGCFTKLSFEKILSFSSQYSIKMYEVLEMKAKQSEAYHNKSLLEFEYDLIEFKELLLGQYNRDSDKIEIPKSYHKFYNFKTRILDPAQQELKDKGDYFFDYEVLKTRQKITAIKFIIHKNADKIREDFQKKKKSIMMNSTTNALAKEQIRRMIERQGSKIRDKLRYEQKMYQLYLKGELKFDKDIQEVIDNMGIK